MFGYVRPHLPQPSSAHRPDRYLFQSGTDCTAEPVLRDRLRAIFISAPIRRIRSPCCAFAASGHAAALPSSLTNGRRVRPVGRGRGLRQGPMAWAAAIRRPSKEGGPSNGGRSCGSFGGQNHPGGTATAPIEDIWCEKIRGCSYRGSFEQGPAPLLSHTTPDGCALLRICFNSTRCRPVEQNEGEHIAKL